MRRHPVLAGLPACAPKPVKLELSLSGLSGLRRGHPWVYAERVQRQSHVGSAGDLAVVFDRKRRFAAVGLYDPHAPIRMRALRFAEPGPIDAAFFAAKVARAVARRRPLLRTPTDGYRLIHGESDGLPGLVADRYADTTVVKLYSAAWVPHLAACVEALIAAISPARVVLRLGRRMREHAASLAGLEDGQVLAGALPSEALRFRENGLRFEVDPVRGHKTGCFLDQRDNRARVESLAAGCRVLDVFAYSGGFSLYAARGGAREVWSLDQSRPALDSAERNFQLNRHLPAVSDARHLCIEGDAFRALAELARKPERFDLVILDPPALASRRSQVDAALEAYARLTRLGTRLLAPGARIVLASCSRPIPPERFRSTVLAAAASAGRPLRGVEETGHALDHPTDFAESRYLKCLFAVS